MKEHLDILLLLNYAQGKILDETQHDQITDHLCKCEFCQRILKSHYFLIHNHDGLLERFFPGPDLVEAEETIDPAAQKGIQFSPNRFIQNTFSKIQSLKKQGGLISQEIKLDVQKFLDEIKSFPNLEESLVPLKVENITLLGAEETPRPKEQTQKHISGNIKLRFLTFQGFKIEDFDYQFTGKFFYVSFEKENFMVLKDRKVNLTTDLGFPFIFTTTFKETHKSVNARFKIEFEEMIPVEEFTSGKEVYHEFFLSIE